MSWHKFIISNRKIFGGPITTGRQTMTPVNGLHITMENYAISKTAPGHHDFQHYSFAQQYYAHSHIPTKSRCERPYKSATTLDNQTLGCRAPAKSLDASPVSCRHIWRGPQKTLKGFIAPALQAGPSIMAHTLLTASAITTWLQLQERHRWVTVSRDNKAT